MKTRVVATQPVTLRSGKQLEKGEVIFIEEDEAAALVAENKVIDRVATAARSAAILPDKPSISSDKCRQL
jgi:hypothetical protein